MIKTKITIANMPCECNTICGIDTFDWHIITKENVFYFRIVCKACQKYVEHKAMATISLEPETISEETPALSKKKIATTIWEAKEDLDKYLASLPEEAEKALSLKKEYIH